MPSYVIVGASKGLGYEWLRQLSQDKEITVIGLVRDLDAVQARLASDNITNVKLFYADMSDHQSLTKAASGVAEVTDGSLDHLIINAAYQPFDSWHYYLTEYVDKEELLKTEVFRSTDVNILGTIYAVNAFLPLIRRSDVKKVVSISSGHADMDLILDGGVAVSSVYSAIKAAGNVIMAKYAAELKSEGVKFLSLSPGYVLTGQPEPTAEQAPRGMEMGAQFASLYPEWRGPILPPDSVQQQKKVIDELTIEKSGQFLSHWGNKQWL